MREKSVNQGLREERKRAVAQARKAIEDISIKSKVERERIVREKDMAIAKMKEQSEQQAKHDLDSYNKRSMLLNQLTNAAQTGDLEEMKRIRSLLNELPKE